MELINNNLQETLSTLILLAIIIFLRIVSAKLIKKYAQTSEILEHRINLIVRYNNIFLNIIFFIALFIIWGVQKDDIVVTLSSVLTVIGIAFFAQWSILSNITSGIILLFSFPFKIGDIIRIHDKDFPIEAEIEDIRAFHTYLRTKEGEMITYPNTLLLQKGISVIKDHSFSEKEFTD